MLPLKPLLTAVGTVTSVVLSSYLGSTLSRGVDTQVSLSQPPSREEIVLTPKIEAEENIVYVDRLTLKRELAGVRRKDKRLTAAYEPIKNYFGKADVIKSKDQGLWYEFVRDFRRNTDEDTLKKACEHYSKQLVSYFENKQWLKGKIRDYCFVKKGSRL